MNKANEQYTRVNPHRLVPGVFVIFRCNGTGNPLPATVLPRGPYGQFVVDLHGGGPFAVNEDRELFERAP